jgi:hypothetical protein
MSNRRAASVTRITYRFSLLTLSDSVEDTSASQLTPLSSPVTGSGLSQAVQTFFATLVRSEFLLTRNSASIPYFGKMTGRLRDRRGGRSIALTATVQRRLFRKFGEVCLLSSILHGVEQRQGRSSLAPRPGVPDTGLSHGSRRCDSFLGENDTRRGLLSALWLFL